MAKQAIYDEVKKLGQFCKETSVFLWNNPELGGNEKVSADYIRNLMKKEGFTIINEEKLPYAFCAEYGTGKPVIAILGEYDALPKLSQRVCAAPDAVEAGAPGHGCGHNLLGAAAATAAIALKRMKDKEGVSGTIRFYGCPEEELLSGKVKMAYYHMFDGCDIALSWHPGAVNQVFNKAYLASSSAKFYFTGKTSHAGFAPERGRSALDAVELMNVGCNYLREHVTSAARIHYTTDSCGFPPNIVPDKAVAWYCVRAPRISDVKEILERIQKVAKGAAMMTETEVDIKIEYGCCEYNPNDKFAELTQKNLLEAPLPEYTEEEIKFAKELQATLSPDILNKDETVYDAKDLGMSNKVEPADLYLRTPLNASSDSGDVSYMMPMNLFTAATWPVGVAPHTWQATASAGSSIGEKGAVIAANVIAGTAYDLLTNPELVAEIKAEFEDKKTEEYSPMYFE